MMGLSTKQVSSSINDGLDWSQSSLILQPPPPPPPILHPTPPAAATKPPPPPTSRRNQMNQLENQSQNQSQSQSEPLKCPRCDSTNTKFCYYNNYNKSQPRYFCKACKRHWTKGGTLRNVPVGGGRKNKRPHKPSSGSGGNGKIINKANPRMVIQAAQQNKKPKQSISTSGGRASNDVVVNGVIDHPPSLLPLSSLNLPSPMGGPPAESDSINFDDDEGIGGFVFTQGLSFPNYSASSSSSAISTSASAAVASFDGQFLGGGGGYAPATWQLPSTIGGVGSGNMNDISAATATASGGAGGFWNWDVDMDNLVSSADLNIPWDDSEIKP